MYISIWVQSSSAVLTEIPHHPYFLLTGSIHRATQAPFRGSQPCSSAHAWEMYPKLQWGCKSPNQPVGLWTALNHLYGENSQPEGLSQR